MPRFTFWTVRLALIYLFLGFTSGALLLANKGIPFAAWIWRLLPLHVEFLIFGFISQLVIGIAYWIYPRFSGGRRGNENLYWTAVFLLNLGLWLVGCSGFIIQARWFMWAGRTLEGLAAVLFASNSWVRIRASSAST